ncbi:MAG TPA: T9SS type A sorting domain-containing protein, partial [Bacteroidia bacterium]|nr:T9SS type A sorting domain-containing protein [Bacteroidia bacterium]
YNPVVGATNYRIKIENASLGYSQIRVKGNNGTYISMNNFSGLQINMTYTVTIASYVGGIWSAYGPPCTITMSGSTRHAEFSGDEQPAFNFAILMYPNPLGDNVDPTVNITGADGQAATINIVDITGRVITTYEIQVTGDNYSTVLEGFPDLVAGIYFMQVQVGSQVQKHKFIAE